MTVLSGIVLLAALVVLARIDARTGRLPNVITIPLMLAGLVWSFDLAEDLYWHLIGAALGYGVFWAVEVIYRLVRKRDGLGRGDAKLLAAGGAWCGVFALPFIVFAASVGALVVQLAKGAKADTRFAFGPYLCLAIGGVWLIQRGL